MDPSKHDPNTTQTTLNIAEIRPKHMECKRSLLLLQAEAVQAAIERIFASEGTTIYTGYVDDPRNTDNAWMETVFVRT
jgi:hypothetical protein